MGKKVAVPEVQYAERIVGFADVLGWRAHIAETLEDPMRLLFLHTIVEGWSNLSRGDYSVNYSDLNVSSFSDNVVFSQELQGAETLLVRMAMMQVGAAGGGFLIRGGISVGKIIHTSHAVFGPALNRAYEIESTMAIFPRIVIDENVLPHLPLIPPLIVQEDGLYFLDPFTPSFLQSVVKYADGVDVSWAQSEKYIGGIGTHLQNEIRKHPAEKEAHKLVWLYLRLAKNFKSSIFEKYFPLPWARAYFGGL